MKSLLIVSLVLAPLAATPAVAASIADHPPAAQHRVGAFAGARLRIAMGGEHAGQPRIGLAVAGIDHRRAGDGGIGTRFAEGVEFGFAADRRLGLSLAGRPLRATKASLQDEAKDDDEGGISTGLLIAGGVLVALGVGTLLFVDAMNDSSE